ncbi:MAG TPA: hypothetical protein PLG17_11775, partial [Thermodesulfobacteriota bacterium]|nr:hypothetical protein [Thermodesulfobacteriota bacterium]
YRNPMKYSRFSIAYLARIPDVQAVSFSEVLMLRALAVTVGRMRYQDYRSGFLDDAEAVTKK